MGRCRHVDFRREAAAKATGVGLAAELDGKQDREVMSPAPVRGGGKPWTLIDFKPTDGFVAAMVVEGPVGALRCWESPIK